MTFEVIIQRQAELDVQQIYDWIAKRSPQGGERWFEQFRFAMERLQGSPETYGLALEAEDHPQEIRQIFFKTKRSKSYRALFLIIEGKVHVLHVRGPGQRFLNSDEL